MAKLTFEQREGVAPLPTQLQPKEVSDELRALIWRIFSTEITPGHSSMRGGPFFNDPWKTIMHDIWTYRDHRVSDFVNRFNDRMAEIQGVVAHGDYAAFFGLLEWILRHPSCPGRFRDRIGRALVICRAAYRVVDHDTIMPITNPQEAETVNAALASASEASLSGATQHLKASVTLLRDGSWPDSVRESVHAVEATARAMTGERELGPALRSLEKSGTIHEALKRGFGAIYGWTSDEQGIRHPIVDGPSANVDETDALFMLGACASFVSYLIAKGRAAGVGGQK